MPAHDILTLKTEDATSTEFNPQTPVVIFIPEISETYMVGMRLGRFCGCKAAARKLYRGKERM